MPIQLVENSVVAGRFRLNRMIGRGGMGSVWQATHLGLDIPCAVKFMEGEIAQSLEAQGRFEREAKAAAQLRSPHVVQVLDHGICEGTPYIAMELLDGEDLGKRLQRLGKIHPRDLNVIITQVCRALTKAHSVQIVHRDLKPDNIFLVHDDDREIAKVLDFGIAKSNMGSVEGSNTKTGAMLGTPYYMSPEQAQGIKSVDFRSDLWSLAVIVFQCLTGILPFESEALGDLLVRIIVQPLPVPSQVADVPAGFDRWWARAASRDPVGRFQSAKEFGESLQLVFGASQATDVMDRAQLKAMLGGTPMPGTNPAAGRMMTPSGFDAAPMASPMGMTPNPGFAPSQNKLAATTGGPMARSFAESDAGPVAIPKRGQALAIVGAAAGLFIAVAAVGVMAVRSKAGPASAGAQPQAAAITAPAAQAPPQPAPPPSASTPAPPQPAAAVVPATPAPIPAPAAAPPADPPKPAHSHTPRGQPPAPPPAQAPAKPAPPKAAAPRDLGF